MISQIVKELAGARTIPKFVVRGFAAFSGFNLAWRKWLVVEFRLFCWDFGRKDVVIAGPRTGLILRVLLHAIDDQKFHRPF